MTASFDRRRFLATSAAATAAACAHPLAWGQDTFPSRPVQVILPIPPGGIVDTVARMVTERMQANVKQPFVIQNKPGGSYVIGVTAAAAAPADGYTILTMHIGLMAAQAAMRQFNLFDNFVPIGMIGALPSTVTVSASSPFANVADMVKFARANPGKLNYATPGLGTVEHLKSVEFERAAGFVSTHVPYKGGPEMVMSLITGDAHFSILPNALAEPYVTKGQLRYLAPLSSERLAAYPNLPTAREQGVDMELNSWMGFMVRKGTPQQAIDVLARETTRAMKSPELQARFRNIGVTPTYTNSPEAFGERLHTDFTWMSKIVKDTNLKVG